MLGVLEEGPGWGLLHDLAVLHDGDPVGYLGDDGKIVGDEEHGKVVGLAQVFQQFEYLGLNGNVERGGGFVGNEQAGTVDKGHGDEDALALASGELMGVVLDAALGLRQADLMHGGQNL